MKPSLLGPRPIKPIDISNMKPMEKYKHYADPYESEGVVQLVKNPDEDAWIQTYSGKKFYPLSNDLGNICIEDIAHALSMQCRFTGHVGKFYSVAQHSALVSENCDNFPLQALLHDASEAYISDISSPLKKTSIFDKYREIEGSLQKNILKSFEIEDLGHEEIKNADLRMLATESRDLIKNRHPDFKISFLPYDFNINPMLPEQAKNYFLYTFYKLMMHRKI